MCLRAFVVEPFSRLLTFQFLQYLPRPLGFVAEKHYVALALIEIQSKTRLDVTFGSSIVSTRNVIDVNYHSPAFGMGELDEFHSLCFLK
jgi:hypothetical protein